MPTRRALVSAVLAAAAGLSACTGSTPAPAPDTTRSHAGRCRTECSGVAAGAPYAIRTPAHWNGTLLIYSHGFVAHRNASARPSLAQQDDGHGPVAATLLREGYALAGSAYAGGGWTVASAVLDADRVHRRFVATVGTPRRVYVWGSSMGGLITELAAERYGWVDGALPMCGVLGGPLANADNLAEAVVGAQALLALPVRDGAAATQRALASALRAPQGAAKVRWLAALLGLPDRSGAHPGTGLADRVQAAAQSLATYLGFAFTVFPVFVAQFGGRPGRALGPAARTALPADALADVAALGGDAEAYDAVLRRAVAPATDAAARAALEASGDPTGRLRVPTLTLHTTDDPIVLAGNEALFRARAAAHGGTARLAQLLLGPTPADPHAGTGHCAFSPAELTAAVGVLDTWVRTGRRPATSALPAALRAPLDPGAGPAWPTTAN